ncbi:hypothetical protein PVAP13_5NG450620 [Panicum virgatum]|uniref:Uncharacterized protein n=1 Tax=Panicum virgatum TaxID=38727 RepID=A0A8T0RZL1_PANVG|nr:hypothetical protein PVAP13_5NG450620 [Panicum virgatum]
MACALESLASSEYCLRRWGHEWEGSRPRGQGTGGRGSARRSRIGVPRSRGGRVRATAPGASAPAASATVQLAAAWPDPSGEHRAGEWRRVGGAAAAGREAAHAPPRYPRGSRGGLRRRRAEAPSQQASDLFEEI